MAELVQTSRRRFVQRESERYADLLTQWDAEAKGEPPPPPGTLPERLEARFGPKHLHHFSILGTRRQTEVLYVCSVRLEYDVPDLEESFRARMIVNVLREDHDGNPVASPLPGWFGVNDISALREEKRRERPRHEDH